MGGEENILCSDWLTRVGKTSHREGLPSDHLLGSTSSRGLRTIKWSRSTWRADRRGKFRARISGAPQRPSLKNFFVQPLTARSSSFYRRAAHCQSAHGKSRRRHGGRQPGSIPCCPGRGELQLGIGREPALDEYRKHIEKTRSRAPLLRRAFSSMQAVCRRHHFNPRRRASCTSSHHASASRFSLVAGGLSSGQSLHLTGPGPIKTHGSGR